MDGFPQGDAAPTEEWIGRRVGRREVGGRMFGGTRRTMMRESNPSTVGNRGLPVLAVSQQLDPRYMAEEYRRVAERRERLRIAKFKQSVSTQMLLESARERLDEMPTVYM